MSLIQEIIEIGVDCKKGDWVGLVAIPVTTTQVLQAVHTATIIPEHITEPDVCAEPDGVIAFEWNTDKAALSMSIEADKPRYGSVTYVYVAVTFSSNSVLHSHASEVTRQSDSTLLPEEILGILDRYFKKEDRHGKNTN